MDRAASRPRVRRLSTQVTLLLFMIILATVGSGFVMSFVDARKDLDRHAGELSLAIARTVAADPVVVRAFAAPNPAAAIDPIAESARRASGAAFVVVANRQGVRYSHPNPALIGTSLLHDPGENPSSVLGGKTFLGVEQGSLGRSMRAKVPVVDAQGHVIGLVSVGVLETRVSAELRSNLLRALIPPLLGLALGIAGSSLLARRIKRQTYGLEPAEITALLEQREAMLHGVREGVITVDVTGRVTLVNDEAQRLLDIDRFRVGERLTDVVADGRVLDVLTGRTSGRDEVILLGDRILVVNRMPVELRGRAIGAITTLRDQTELEALSRELDDVRGLADALRAQEHEFASRLHVIGGLIELHRYDDAVQYINMSSQLHQDLAESLLERVGDPIVSGLLLGKASVASERGVQLRVSALTDLPEQFPDSHALVTIIGNLVDNALDSVQGRPDPRVNVTVAVEEGALVVVVHDSGPGVDSALVGEIFKDGFTTKVSRDRRWRRGIGLALVSHEVRRRGGQLTVENVDGALFRVVLPLEQAPSSAASARAVGELRPA